MVGSIYIPEVNYIMMVLTVIVVAVFKTTVQLGNAYGKTLGCSLITLPAFYSVLLHLTVF